jgi:CRP-like cAMP-binding protein
LLSSIVWALISFLRWLGSPSGPTLRAGVGANHALLDPAGAQNWTFANRWRYCAREMGSPSEEGTFLDLLDGADREKLEALCRRTRFPRGTMLMHQGEPGERVMVLLDGHVKATSITPEGHELVLSFRGPGDVLGELSFINEQRRSSNVAAIEPVEALVLSARSFRSFLESTPSAAVTMIDVLGRRFRDANLKRVQFGASDTLGRVCARLVELAERYGEPDDGGVRIRLPITQEELGSWTASSRAGVAKALQTLRELGWIATERKRITVRDIDALAGRAA